MPRIVVVGSIHTDLVITVPRLPARGETLLGGEFHTFPGGKGANQAVAAAKLGADTWLVGRVGHDLYGEFEIESLEAAGVCTGFVRTDWDAPSGVALITVEEGGENTIVVAAGASGRCAPSDVDEAEDAIAEARALLLQLEIPLETVEYAAKMAARHGVPVILDPAPARPLPASLLECVDVITPNESEAAVLCGLDPAAPNDPARMAAKLAEKVRGPVLITLGGEGVYALAGGEELRVPAVPVQPVDATAAGDTFNGALATALAGGSTLEDAIRWANHAAALSVTRLGAQASIPTRAEVEAFIAARKGEEHE